MLCSDGKRPDELVTRHINQLVAWAVAKGHSWFDVFQTPISLTSCRCDGCVLMVKAADLKVFNALNVWVDGELLAEQGNSLVEPVNVESQSTVSTPGGLYRSICRWLQKAV